MFIESKTTSARPGRGFFRLLCLRSLPALAGLLLIPLTAAAQTFPTPDYFRKVMLRPQSPAQVPGPEGLRDFVKEGKLRLNVADTIKLVLANNTDVRINRLALETSQFSLIRSYTSFDPVLTASFGSTRSTNPTASQIDGAPILSSLGQTSRAGWSQNFQTGTNVGINFTASRSVTNSSFSTFNPSLSANLNFTVSQPLLRNRGLFPNRAPIVIAQRNLRQTRANFEAQVSTSIQAAVDLYWGVIQARENLKVLQRSLELAEATYAQNKRALELGALPPLDIYRSESQVASRRVAVIQAEYALKQTEDDFRRTIGADLDPQIRALDLDLIEKAEPMGELATMDAAEALQRALVRRPELEALRQTLANDDTNLRLAHNSMQPDLNLTAFFTSNGLGGNRLDTSVTPPVIIAQGGLGDAFDQIGSWNFPSYGFTLSLRLPIRNRAAEADRGNALVSKRRDLYQLRSREQAIELEVRNAVHNLESAKLSMAASRIARDTAQKNLEAEQKKYELGVQTIFFVLDAQTGLAQAEQSLLQSQVSYQRALTALDRSMGDLLERHRIQITEPATKR